MILPLGTDRTLRRPTRVSYALIGVNVAVYLAGVILHRASPEAEAALVERLWLNPEWFRWWGLVTYQFLHGGLMHLLGNMLFLFVFGPNVEDRLGRFGFLLFYLAGGAAAGGLHALFAYPPSSVVGASGAIAAVTGAFFVLFPRTHVRVLIVFFVIGLYEWPAAWFLGLAMAKDAYLHAADAAGNVAVLAHIGGYLFGGLTALLLLATGALPREACDLFSIGRHAQRRRRFKELASQGGGPWLHEAARKHAGATGQPAAVPLGAAAVPGEIIAAKRAEIARAVAEGRLDDAGARYLELVELTGEAVMSRDVQLALGNHFAATQRYAAASAAYEAFLKRYPADREAPQARMMLALVAARYLNDPVRAKALIAEVRRGRDADKHLELIELLEKELG